MEFFLLLVKVKEKYMYSEMVFYPIVSYLSGALWNGHQLYDI